jgi:hypothetical protein
LWLWDESWQKLPESLHQTRPGSAFLWNDWTSTGTIRSWDQKIEMYGYL